MGKAQDIALGETVFQIPVAAIVPSKFNPRGKASSDQDKLKDLACDIARRGVQQPILLRPIAGNKYEIVFGERRWAASKLAKFENCPAFVRDIDDAQAKELCVIENLQRADLHFLDEAVGFDRLLKTSINGVEQLAAVVGKPAVYVYGRLVLNNLTDKWVVDAHSGKLPLMAALLVARQTPSVQNAMHKELSGWGQHAEHWSASSLKSYIERQCHQSLAKAPFDTEDARLVPAAGPCTTCPKRSGASPLLFIEIKQADVCTDRECFDKKCSALLAKKKKEFPGAVLVMGDGLNWQEKDALKKQKMIPRRDDDINGWVPSKKEACKATFEALVGAGAGTGTHLYICRDATCPLHGDRQSSGSSTPSKPGTMNAERREQVEELWQRRTRLAIRMAVHHEIRQLQAHNPTVDEIPLEAFRSIVYLCAKNARNQQDGNKYFQELWPVPPEKEKADDDFTHESSLHRTIEACKSKDDLLRLLTDIIVAQDVAGKFSGGDEIEDLAAGYELDLKVIGDPIRKSWEEKKAASYAKRDARLAAEKKKAAKPKEKKAKKAKAK